MTVAAGDLARQVAASAAFGIGTGLDSANRSMARGGRLTPIYCADGGAGRGYPVVLRAAPGDGSNARTTRACASWRGDLCRR